MVLAQHHGSVNSCSFSKDGRKRHITYSKIFVLFGKTDLLLVSVGYDSNVNVWNNNTHQLQNTYKVRSNFDKHYIATYNYPYNLM